MTVRGRIVSMSHLGGLLVNFEGVPPGLGDGADRGGPEYWAS